METIWFWLVACMLAAYVIFDGFDFGAGIVHFFVARTNDERSAVLSTVGPVWDGNEVWLLAAGGTLYFAFPTLYASSFSGFYLPLMMVLWLLILRGVSIEFRNHVQSPVWHPLWDAGFSIASALLAIFFGAALGNVVRGVPLDAQGEFFLPLWTDWTPGKSPGILDWYTVLSGVAALAALALHGSLWVALKTKGEIESRARRAASTTTQPVRYRRIAALPPLWENYARRHGTDPAPRVAEIRQRGRRLPARQDPPTAPDADNSHVLDLCPPSLRYIRRPPWARRPGMALQARQGPRGLQFLGHEITRILIAELNEFRFDAFEKIELRTGDACRLCGPSRNQALASALQHGVLAP